MNVAKPAGFWIRFSALMIDLIIFLAIILPASLVTIKSQPIPLWPQKQLYTVQFDWSFYFWCLLLIFCLTVQFLLVPLMTKGKTIGMLLVQLKVNFEQPQGWKTKVFLRWQLSAGIWILVAILFMALVQPPTINKISLFGLIQNNQADFQKLAPATQELLKASFTLTSWETALLSIPATTSSFNIMAQVFLLISIGIRKGKIGLLDHISTMQVVYLHKTVYLNEKTPKLIEPEKMVPIELDWKN